jgi:hypothetical protein
MVSAACAAGPAPRAGASAPIPGPLVDDRASTPGTSETAVLAGGCCWGVQAVFQHVRGVSQVFPDLYRDQPVLVHAQAG